MTGNDSESMLADTSPSSPVGGGLLSTVGGMTVGEAMRPGLVTCSPRASLHDLAHLMATSGVHAIVVWGDEDVDAEGIWGVVSDGDFINAAVAGVETAQAAVGVAGARVVRVRADEPLMAAATLMRGNSVTHLIVVSEKGHPIGILSALDVARAATKTHGGG
jgi:CBS domain-containing protein